MRRATCSGGAAAAAAAAAAGGASAHAAVRVAPPARQRPARAPRRRRSGQARRGALQKATRDDRPTGSPWAQQDGNPLEEIRDHEREVLSEYARMKRERAMSGEDAEDDDAEAPGPVNYSPEWAQPGMYTTIVERTAVEAAVGKGSSLLGVLALGTELNVLELEYRRVEKRLRGRVKLNKPSGGNEFGWISLENMENGYRWVSSGGTVPADNESASTDALAPYSAVAQSGSRPKYRFAYGPDGMEMDPLKRIEKEAETLMEQHSWPEEDELGPLPEPGQGPKPVWSFLDAGPRGWWPGGEWFVGAPPADPHAKGSDKSLIPRRNPNTKPLAMVKNKGISSTLNMRDQRDSWLASQSVAIRLGMAVANRLSPDERETLKAMQMVLRVAIGLFCINFALILWEHWNKQKIVERSDDPKFALIMNDLRKVLQSRPDDLYNFEVWFQETMPIPSDYRAALELEWRELIKLGWIEVDPDFQDWVDEPFQMKWIPGHPTQRELMGMFDDAKGTLR